MTLLDEIKAKCSPELLASRDSDAIAAAVNIGRVRVGYASRESFSMWAAKHDVRAKIEDHANNTPFVVQKLRKAADNLAYIYGMEMIHGCQAIDLRMRKNKIRLGKRTEAAWKAFRKEVALYENDRPISPDIQKSYEFIKSNILLSEVVNK